MAALATLDDYAVIYGQPDDGKRVEALLAYAGEFLESELARAGRGIDESDGLQASALRRISCRLVNSLVSAGDVMPGVSQSSMTAGPFSNSWTFSNPTGAFKLLKSERATLGVGGLRAGSVAPLVHGA